MRRPYLEVDSALYRFRILNGSNARIFRIARGDGRPLVLIGNDGGLLPAPDQVVAAASNVAHKLLYGGVADLRPMPRTLIDDGNLLPGAGGGVRYRPFKDNNVQLRVDFETDDGFVAHVECRRPRPKTPTPKSDRHRLWESRRAA